MNKRKVISIILYIVAAICIICFGLLLCQDYLVLYPHGSAPFGLYVIIRAIEFLLPALLCLVVGIVIARKSKKAAFEGR